MSGVIGRYRFQLWDKDPLDVVHDTGWQSNIVTDYYYRIITEDPSIGNLTVFTSFFETLPDPETNTIPGVNFSSTPGASANGLVVNRTTVMGATGSGRDINTVGLCNFGVSDNWAIGVVAYSSLPITLTQLPGISITLQYELEYVL